MKVAVLLFGQPRFFNITKQLIREEFELPGHTVDFFAHFWDKVGYLPDGSEEVYDPGELQTNFDFKEITIENYDEVNNSAGVFFIIHQLLVLVMAVRIIGIVDLVCEHCDSSVLVG